MSTFAALEVLELVSHSASGSASNFLGPNTCPTLISAWRFPRKSVRSDIENSFGADQVIRPEQSFTNITPKGQTVLQGHVYFLVGHDQLSRT